MRSPRELKTLLLLPLMAFSPLVYASEVHPPNAGEAPTVEEDAPTIPRARRIAVIQWKDYVPNNSQSLQLTGENDELLSIVCKTQTGGTTRLFQIGAPKISSRYYALKGEIRQNSVSGTGYLELLHHFPGVEKEFFSRTVAESGPTRRIEGRSDWRTFWIPFNAAEAPGSPDRLTLNLVLTSIAQITFGPLELYEFTDAKSMMEVATTGDDTGPRLSLSRPERRLGMAVTLLLLTSAVGGIHFVHLRREKARREAKGQAS